MRRVVKVTGLSAKVADCVGAKVVVPVMNHRGEVVQAKASGHGSKAETVGKNRRQLVLDSIDLFVLNNAKAFESPIAAHRSATTYKLSSAVNCR